MEQAVQTVTIKNKITLYKGEEPANSIELIEMEENGFHVVSQKGLYEIGDKAVYIEPDYCVSDIPLFESFIRPNGDESKSMLGKIEGKPRRIRAKKFNFSKEPNGDVIYSNGILLPINEIESYLKEINSTIFSFRKDCINLDNYLGITKYEEPEQSIKGGVKRGGSPYPNNIYKTDETNINKVWNNLKFPYRLIGTVKEDGSSITLGIVNGKPFVASKNVVKPFKIKKVVGRRKKTLLEKILFWKKVNLNIYKEMDNDDEFVVYAKPYIEILEKRGNQNILFRGELRGKGMKGSGNKNNPASKLENGIVFYSIDTPVNGIFQKLPNTGFKGICEAYNFPTVNEVFNQIFNSKEELQQICLDYFKQNLVEGIVIRSADSKFSAKFMNDEYDSKK